MANGKWYSTHNSNDYTDRSEYSLYHWSFIESAYLNSTRSKVAVYKNNTDSPQYITTFTMYIASGNRNYTWGGTVNGNGGNFTLQASAGGSSFNDGIKSDKRSGPDGQDQFALAGSITGTDEEGKIVYAADSSKCQLTTFTFEDVVEVPPTGIVNIYLNVVDGNGNCVVAKRNNADHGGNVLLTPPVVTYTVTFNNNGFGPDTYSIAVEANSSITFPEYDTYTMDHHKIYFNANGGVAHDEYL
jgi:hypothetical protein